MIARPSLVSDTVLLAGKLPLLLRGPCSLLNMAVHDSGFSETSTLRTVVAACELAGLDSDGAVLVRLGEHAVYRLHGGVVVRVARTAAYLRDAQKEIAVARWLEAVGVPAVRVVDLDQPVVVDGRVVAFWGAVADGDEYGTPVEVAELLRQLHGLEAPSGLELPELRPFARAERRIEAAPGLAAGDRMFLRDRLAELRERYAGLDFALPGGVIHGDASVGNVLRDRTGRPVLIDLDGIAIGPREWDLTLTATYYDSFGWHTREEYAQFVEVYGFDVMAWSGYPVLRDIREFIMVTWLGQKTGDGGKVDAEVAKRIAALRDGGSRRDWQPH